VRDRDTFIININEANQVNLTEISDKNKVISQVIMHVNWHRYRHFKLSLF